MSFWKTFFDELDTPSGQIGPLNAAYQRATSAIGHAVLGAAIVALLSQPWAYGFVALQVCIVAAYWWLKERGDLRRGGALADGLEDAAMVGLGTFYHGPWLWPVIVLAVGFLIMWRGYYAR